jgi:hypothetical protein
MGRPVGSRMQGVKRLPAAGGLLLLLTTLGVAACEKSGPQTPAPGRPRVFRLALTPFPAEPTPASFAEAYQFVGDHAEAVSNHFDDGIPWDSALARRDPPEALRADLEFRRYRAAQLGLRNYVSVSWLTTARDSLALGYGRTPRPAAIASDPSFANPAVRSALKFWCTWLALYMEPDTFSPGVELNFYARHRPADWPHLVTLYREVYDTLKLVRPSLQVAPTWQLDELHEHGQWSLLGALDTRADALALSLYPSGYDRGAGRLTPYNLPADYIGRARAHVRSGRPLWISETGYGDSALAAFGTPGSPQLQRDYLEWIAWQADSLGAKQLTWFFPSDPWGVLETAPPEQRGALDFFGPMGLRKRDGTAKLALLAWNQHRRRPYQGSILP